MLPGSKKNMQRELRAIKARLAKVVTRSAVNAMKAEEINAKAVAADRKSVQTDTN